MNKDIKYPCYMKALYDETCILLALSKGKGVVIDIGIGTFNKGHITDDLTMLPLTPQESHTHIISKLKVGDIVNYRGDGREITHIAINNCGHQVSFGHRQYSFNDSNHGIDKGMVINCKHLPITQKEENTNMKSTAGLKYKPLKSITLKSLVKDNACDTAMDKLTKTWVITFTEVIDWDKPFEDWVIEDVTGGIDFLISKGYVELNKPEIVYSKYKVYTAKSKEGRGIIKLTCILDKYAFRSLSDSWSTGNAVHTSGQRCINAVGDDGYEVKEFDNIVDALKHYGEI